jgi:hypothetical protein
MNLSIMRIIIVITFAFCVMANANPIGLPLGAHVYISSERLTVKVSPTDAAFTATFIFSAPDIEASGTDIQQDLLDLPIWFPEQSGDDPSIAAFWNTFGTNMLNVIKPQKKEIFEKAVGLRAFVGTNEAPIQAFATLYQNGNQRPFKFFAHREWKVFLESPEPGFSCLVFKIDALGEFVRNHAPVFISYRQPLAISEGKGRLFYLPIFENLPYGISTTDTNKYSITISATPDCSLTVISGEQKFTVEAGKSIILGPKDRQAIRAIARRSPTAR